MVDLNEVDQVLAQAQDQALSYVADSGLVQVQIQVLDLGLVQDRVLDLVQDLVQDRVLDLGLVQDRVKE